MIRLSVKGVHVFPPLPCRQMMKKDDTERIPYTYIYLPHHIPHLSTNPDVFLRHKFELAR